MPKDLVLVRHGESEANVMQHLVKEREKRPAIEKLLGSVSLKDRRLRQQMEAVYARPDWEQRLSLAGIEQARAAGRWVNKELGGVASFDFRLRSPFLRTRETSIYLTNPELDPRDRKSWAAADGLWENDLRLVERHWGMFGTLTLDQQRKIYPQTQILKERDPLFTALDGGESIMSGVMNRVREEHSRYHREADGKRVIVNTHGEYIWTERLVNENMLPEEWVALDGDKSQRIRNCAVLQYSRINPDKPDASLDDHLRWMRFVYTDAPDESPYGGDWIEIPRKRLFTTEETLAQLAMFPPLLRTTETPEPVEPWSPPR